MYEKIDMLPVWFYSQNEITDMLRHGYIYRSVWYRLKSADEIEIERKAKEIKERSAEYNSVLKGII